MANKKFIFSKELQIGIVGVVALGILYWGFFFLKGIDKFDRMNTYFVKYDNVDGVQVGTKVFINGFSVGQVFGIELLPEEDYKVLVEIGVENYLDITNKTIAYQKSDGLLGGKVIELQMNAGVSLPSDEYLIGKQDEDLTAKLMAQVSPIITKVDSVALAAERLLLTVEGDMAPKITTSLSNLAIMTDEINGKKHKVERLLNEINAMVASLNDQENGLPAVLGKFNAVADSLQQAEIKSMVASVNTTVGELNKTVEAINNKEGSLGLLVYDSALYNDMDQTIRDLDSLMIDMKESPSRYVHFSLFGRKDKKKD